MPDPQFSEAQQARWYDLVEGDRDDLDHYLAIIGELGAASLLDIGCGTGVFATAAAGHGLQVVGVDPARAMLDIARRRPGGERVGWFHGYLHELADRTELAVDVATMTGNVAQVFVTDDDWNRTLIAAADAIRPGGHLVFETRDPANRAWEAWTRDRTTRRIATEHGPLETWVDLTRVTGGDGDPLLVTFDSSIRVGASDGLRSRSTLRFRPRDDLDRSLDRAGFDVVEVGDAPDRPHCELVYLARRRYPDRRRRDATPT